MKENLNDKCTKKDSQLSIPQYWQKYWEKIISLHNWQSDTIKNYSQMMKKLLPLFSNKPICEVSLFDLTRAVDQVRFKARGGKEYGSLDKFYTVLGHIFRYAKAHGHADDVLRFLYKNNKKKNDESFNFFDCSLSTEQLQKRARKLVQEHPNKVKSLTKQQKLALYKDISEGLLKDGRYIALAIMLYCGLRPSECRALRWKDIQPFQDHPDRRMFVLCKTQGRKGEQRHQMKTSNAYRYIPIHYELEQLLNQRYEHVKTQCQARGVQPDDLPICCYEKQIDTFCKDFQLSALGSDVLNRQSSIKKDMNFYMACMITEDAEASENPAHLSLYVLRRNFCTWVQGETQMDQMERSYVMGHSMQDGRTDLRRRYNDEDSLFRMLQKMDTAVLNGDYNRPPHRCYLSPDSPTVRIANCGTLKIYIMPHPENYAARVTAVGLEADRSICVTANDLQSQKLLHSMKADITSLEPSKQFPPLNTECDEKDAWKAVVSAAREKPEANGVAEGVA